MRILRIDILSLIAEGGIEKHLALRRRVVSNIEAADGEDMWKSSILKIDVSCK